MRKLNGPLPPTPVPDGPRLDGLRWALVGPGRVGTSLAWWLGALGATLTSVAGRRPPVHGLPPATAGGGQAPAYLSIDQLESRGLDLLVLAVSDPALEAVARELARRPQAPVALHVSGHFDAEILDPLRHASGSASRGAAGSRGAAIGSLHPLRAFPEPSTSVDDAGDLVFAVDGDASALDLARRIAGALGGRSFEIAGRRRIAYHLAASLAAGGVMTVLAAAEELAEAAELPPELVPAYLDLARGAMDRVNPLGAADRTSGQAAEDGRPVAAAITGPMARGDRPVLERQRAALVDLAPGIVPLFDRLVAENRRIARPATAPTRLDGGPGSPGETRDKKE